MTTPPDHEGPAAEPEGVLPPQGQRAGVPYDLRRPTKARFKARLWNPADRRLFPPKAPVPDGRSTSTGSFTWWAM